MPNLAIQTQDASRRSLTMAIAKASIGDLPGEEKDTLKAKGPAGTAKDDADGIATAKGKAAKDKKAADEKRIPVDRSPQPPKVIETPAMAIARSMRSAHAEVKEHDNCVCVWHVIGRVSDAVGVTLKIQTRAVRFNVNDGERREPGLAASMKDAFQSTREKIARQAEEASTVTQNPEAAERKRSRPTREGGIER